MEIGSRPTALRRLADAVGIVPAFLDQTGTEWRETSEETCVALLGAMGIDASTEAAADAALRALRTEERRELIPPVRVVERSDDTGARHVPIRMASPPNAEARWTLTLELESGETHTAQGPWPDGRGAELPIPWPDDPLYGYHRLRVTVDDQQRVRAGQQTLIVVPSRCVLPSELLGDRRAFGLVANLYSVRSERNWGVGDFGDLDQLVKWTASLGGAFVGVNPLHALANAGPDISPYSPISRLFRNAIYVSVDRVPELHDAPNAAARLDRPELEAELESLREDPQVRYEAVMALKMPMLEELHRAFAREQERDSPRAKAYDEFWRANDPELTRLATYVAIAESRSEWNWRKWPEALRDATSDSVAEFQRQHAERIDLHRWIQFELDRQLEEVARSARSTGMPIGLYQDLAIGTSPTGADTWGTPDLFVSGASIGAPPDPYAASGQNWRLPPIDPRALERDRYRYFIRLVQSGFRHAGALRIDHVMGLFRLFWIPEGKTGKEGAYVRYPAEDLLGILALESVRHNALVVGEDLGTVPEEVPPALAKWGVLSSKVLYFEREWNGDFRSADRYEALALATANTHDMATLVGFWAARDIDARDRAGLLGADATRARTAREEREREKQALLTRLAEEGILDGASAPNDAILRGAVHEFLCRTRSVLVGIALDDLAGEQDAVNLPGASADQHASWTRKMSMTVEEMQQSPDVKAALRCADRGATSK